MRKGNDLENVLIVQINSQYIHSSLAAWYLKAALPQYGVNCKASVLETHINQPLEKILACIVQKSPDLIGFCCYIWNIETVRKLLPVLKCLLPDCTVVLGGPEVSVRAETFLLENPAADSVVSGPGEYAFSMLCAAADKERIPGLTYRRDGGIVSNPQSVLPKPPPSPYSDEYFQSLRGRISYIESSRGCPFSCAFCLSGNERGMLFFSMEQVKADLLRLSQSGTQTVKFVDRTFNCNPSRAREIWRCLIGLHARGQIRGVCYHFEIGADLLDPESIDLLRSAPKGLFQLEAGLQSFHAPALEACSRGTDMKRLEKNLRALIACGNMHIHIDLIAGLPYESFEIFQDSFNRAFALRPHRLQSGFLKLIYGSRLRDETARYGYRFTPYPPYEVLRNDFIGYDELQRLNAAVFALDKLYNSGRFRRTLSCLLKATRETPYTLFEKLGLMMQRDERGSLSQNDITGLLYSAFCSDHRIDPAAFRDCLALDILSTTPGGVLTQCLQVTDCRLSLLKRRCRADYPSAANQATGILYYKKERGVLVNHDTSDPVTGQGQIHFLPL